MALDLARAGAADLAAALAARTVSAVEATDAAIARIETRDGGINAVVVRDFDRARDAARAADAALAAGDRRPLLGVPITVKESHHVAGLRTTWGFEPFKDFVSTEDAVGVARLKAAGAIILGKTNIPPFLSDWQSANPIYGRTNNPWDLGRSPGGSSGGSAAALAAGMVPLEYGSDIGGSIRIPAALCGVYGHKPSFDLIPTKGHAPPMAGGGPLPLAVVGPLARTAVDLDLALSVLAGPDHPQSVGYRLALPPARHRALKDYRVLMVTSHPGVMVDDEITQALEGLADRLTKAGAAVARTSDLLPDLTAAQKVFGAILRTAMSQGQPGATSISAHDWLGLLGAQLQFRRQWGAVFQSFDVVLTPSFGTVAFPHIDDPGTSGRTLNINGQATPYFDQMAWPAMALLPNLPATAAPLGLNAQGLPMSVQIIGAYLEDRTTIGFASLLEQAYGGFVPPPGY